MSNTRVHWILDYPGVRAKGYIDLEEADLFDMTDKEPTESHIEGHLDDLVRDAVHASVNYHSPDLQALVKKVQALDQLSDYA